MVKYEERIAVDARFWSSSVLAAKCHEAGKTVKLVTGKWRVSADSRAMGNPFKTV